MDHFDGGGSEAAPVVDAAIAARPEEREPDPQRPVPTATPDAAAAEAAIPPDEPLEAARETAKDASAVTVAASNAVEAADAAQRSAVHELRGGDASALSRYRGEVSRRLHRARVMPTARAAGRVLVLIRIAPSGALVGREIVAGSGSAALDAAALASAERAAPFPPVPGATELAFTVPFDFILR